MKQNAGIESARDFIPGSRRPLPIRFEDIQEKVEEYLPGGDWDRLRRAYVYSALHHKGQVRSSGEPYLVHPLEVAWILADLRLDMSCVIAGLLHDIIEDTLATREDIERYFGPDIADIVEGLSNISRIQFTSREHQQAENFRKMLLAMVDDIRVILVKLADRLHNMRTLEYLSSTQQERIARETLEIYAPIAGRLGIYKIRSELEDLAILFLDPPGCRHILAKLREKQKISSGFIDGIRKTLVDQLEKNGIRAEITGRVKRLYSIYRKMRAQNIDVEEVYDYLAFRVITDTPKDCYGALGVIHSLWRPVPGRIKDYIAMPKPNMYQSMHTSVMSDRGHPFEVQIRTWDMHRVAEVGIGAHWKYKEGKVRGTEEDANVRWLRQILEWQQEVQDPREFLKLVKVDLYPEEVYTFTPGGKVLSFPRGATPIDFAFAVHTEVGHRCAGAKINGRLLPLKTELQNGDIVEILTSPSRNPSPDWLNLVRTSRARSKIRHWLNLDRRQRSLELGKSLCDKEFRKVRIGGKSLATEGPPPAVLSELGYSSADDFYAAVGYGKVTPRQVTEILRGRKDFREREEPRIHKAVRRVLGWKDEKVQVEGLDQAMVVLAKCCRPIRGEPIVGYITRGRGISVHSDRCTNVEKLLFDPERRIDVEWESERTTTSTVQVSIRCSDRKGLLARITAAIAEEQSNILNVDARAAEGGQGIISLTLEVDDVDHLGRILERVRGIGGIHSVERHFR
ncbi:MAG: bifunctional (p)ppGpp synthetase/guanosine-3',5'-bis(diphosphate) 3'-pyrophosphohydrolase [Acidobacteriota bacterium]